MKKGLLSCIVVILLLAVCWFSLPKPPLLEGVPFSKAIYSDNQQLLRLTLNREGNYQSYVSLKQVSPLIIKATLLQEDRHYYRHLGINPFAVVRAFIATYFTHNRRYGASTITMQVARMRYDIDSKTIIGKLKQIYYALTLEKYYSKNEILQAYFNLAPYGGNIQGIKAASLIYFNTIPAKLSLAQSLALVVIPQNPVKRMPTSAKNVYLLTQARKRLFEVWQKYYPVSESERVSLSLPLQIYSRKDLPFLAPHFVDYVLSKKNNSPNIQTSLSLHLQNIIERLTHRYLLQKNKLGIHNAAVLLLDTNTMQIKAMLGSANFHDAMILGQINGTLTQRSPGSTLKPFIYALALDEGLITPQTVLKDIPMQFHSYQPENIDDRFLGPITAEQALLLSRNIPAVYLESQLHKKNLYGLLQQANISHLKPENYYGLSLVLGGGEIRMIELVKLYAALINQGHLKTVNYLQKVKPDAGIRILSPEASYITLDMLRQNPPPEMLSNISWKNQLPSVAWKTGTSSAYRDAWAVGIFNHYVIAVWIGDFNPKSNLAVSGYKAAAPLLFQLINALNKTIGILPTSTIDLSKLNIKKVQVCQASGLLPNPDCPKTVATWFIPGISSIKKDTIYRKIPIDPKSGLRACSVTKTTEFKVYEFWPSDVLELFAAAGIKRNIPPPFLKECFQSNRTVQNDNLVITSPINQAVYRISGKTEQLPLTAATSNAGSQLYWFIDKSFYALSVGSKTLFWPLQVGKHSITAMDQNGAISNVSIEIHQ